MGNSPKFHSKRTHTKGVASVDTGFRKGELRFRLHPADSTPFTLTYDEMYDLADALDAAITEQEKEPLL